MAPHADLDDEPESIDVENDEELASEGSDEDNDEDDNGAVEQQRDRTQATPMRQQNEGDRGEQQHRTDVLFDHHVEMSRSTEEKNDQIWKEYSVLIVETP